MKNIFILLSPAVLFIHYLSYLSIEAFAQAVPQNRSKINFGAALAAAHPSAKENNISLLVQGDIADIKKTVEELGGEFRYSTGDIASVMIKSKDIIILSEKPYITRIEARNPFSKIQPMNDSMLIHNRVLPVHTGLSPLTQSYKGDGVVIGFIDTGIDYSHPDFKDSAGKTRIKFLWDQVLPDSAPPMPYNYGQAWTGADIDNGKAAAHLATAESWDGHGTHVASVAAGNGLAINKYAGVAPNADIIFVALDFTRENSILDATKYIYAKAELLGKPCVINASVGDYYGSHDGLNLEAQGIKSQITAETGRSFVAAVGNYGSRAIHLEYTVTSDTNFTWFSGGQNYIAIYADTANFKNVKFAIGADKVTPSYSFRGNIPFSNIASHIKVLKNESIFNGSNRLCTIQSYGDLSGGVYSMEYLITPDSSSYWWRLMTTGSGKLDAWTLNMKTANLSDTAIYPDLKKYKQPDVNSNMVSSFQCLDQVITVGNYINRNQIIDYDTILQIDTTRIPGKLHSSSSHGPTRDGRIKPDITAPGDWTMAALVRSMMDDNIAWGNAYLMAQGGYHSLDGGSSNSSPVVAGIAALYLQMNPTAGWQTVKNAIINCARQDTFTGTNLPDNYWGYGKADAFESLTVCVSSVNDNEGADSEEFNIYPNPTSGTTTLRITNGRITNGGLKVFDLVGREVNVEWIRNSDSFVISRSGVPAGMYFCTLRDGEKIIAAKKLIISK